MKLLKLGTFSIHVTKYILNFFFIEYLLIDSTYILTAVLFFGSHMYIIYESPLIKVKNHGVILLFH